MRKERAVGIDLGTTYSAMAWVDDSGQSALVPNAEGDLLTPTVVLFDDDQVIVGREAKKVGVFDAERFAECAKRDMGHPFYTHPIGGFRLPPEVIQAFVLKKIRQDLARVAGHEMKAVITVPAFFDEPRRKATVDAAHMAGLEVLDIVNEPTAAALAFGEQLGYLKDADKHPEKMFVLVYDLGGGTFDVTLIELEAGNLRTVATDGDVRLGGRDWDECLANRAAEHFLRDHGVDPRQDRVGGQRLHAACEEAKHTLSQRKEAIIRVAHAGHTAEYRVSRDEFEEDTAHLLERTAYVTRQLLTTAGMEWKNVSRILLVGGSTRMPMVAKMLEERTGLAPDHSVNPDEAVARGAAIYAEYLLASRSGRDKARFKITNVNSHSLGIEGVDPRTGRKCNNIIIPRNTPLPARKTERFATKSKGQKSVVVKVLEGESPVPSECTPIGRTAIRGLPENLPAGSPIFVTYEYGVNGRVGVRARVHGTDSETTLELERDGALSSQLVAQWGRLVVAGSGLKSFAQIIAEDKRVQTIQGDSTQPPGGAFRAPPPAGIANRMPPAKAAGAAAIPVPAPTKVAPVAGAGFPPQSASAGGSSTTTPRPGAVAAPAAPKSTAVPMSVAGAKSAAAPVAAAAPVGPASVGPTPVRAAQPVKSGSSIMKAQPVAGQGSQPAMPPSAAGPMHPVAIARSGPAPLPESHPAAQRMGGLPSPSQVAGASTAALPIDTSSITPPIQGMSTAVVAPQNGGSKGMRPVSMSHNPNGVGHAASGFPSNAPPHSAAPRPTGDSASDKGGITPVWIAAAITLAVSILGTAIWFFRG